MSGVQTATIPELSTITIATASGPRAIDAAIYGPFAVTLHAHTCRRHESTGEQKDHHFTFAITHIASGKSVCEDLENREAHWLARRLAANDGFIALCDATHAAQVAGTDSPPADPAIASWYAQERADAAVRYGSVSEVDW